MTDKARDAMKGLVDVWSYIIDTDEATTENAAAWIRLCEAVQRAVDQEGGSASDGATLPAMCLPIHALKADKEKLKGRDSMMKIVRTELDPRDLTDKALQAYTTIRRNTMSIRKAFIIFGIGAAIIRSASAACRMLSPIWNAASTLRRWRKTNEQRLIT